MYEVASDWREASGSYRGDQTIIIDFSYNYLGYFQLYGKNSFNKYYRKYQKLQLFLCLLFSIVNTLQITVIRSKLFCTFFSPIFANYFRYYQFYPSKYITNIVESVKIYNFWLSDNSLMVNSWVTETRSMTDCDEEDDR